MKTVQLTARYLATYTPQIPAGLGPQNCANHSGGDDDHHCPHGRRFGMGSAKCSDNDGREIAGALASRFHSFRAMKTWPKILCDQERIPGGDAYFSMQQNLCSVGLCIATVFRIFFSVSKKPEDFFWNSWRDRKFCHLWSSFVLENYMRRTQTKR